MYRIIARLGLIVTLVAGLLGFAAAMPAQADAQFGCTVSGHTGLHATATRINYGNNRSAIYVSATQSWKQIYTLRADIFWTYYRMTSSSGLSTKYTNPAQWGSLSSPLDLSTEYITITWNGRTAFATTTQPAQCTIKVGV